MANEQPKVKLLVGGSKVKEGSVEVRALEVLTDVLRMTHNVRDEDLSKPSVKIIVMSSDDRVIVDAYVSTAVHEIVKIFSRKCIMAPSKPTMPRRDPEQEQREREQRLWSLATQMYKSGFGQKPDEYVCAVNGCTLCTVPSERRSGSNKLEPAIAVDADGRHWLICIAHFDAGRFVDRLAQETDHALKEADEGGDAASILRLNKAMDKLNALGDPIAVFGSEKAWQAVQPKGTLAQALTKVRPAVGDRPAMRAADPEREPEYTTEVATRQLAGYLKRDKEARSLATGDFLTIGAEEWAAIATYIAGLSAPVGKAGKFIRQAKRAVEHISSERGSKAGAAVEQTAIGMLEGLTGAPPGAVLM